MMGKDKQHAKTNTLMDQQRVRQTNQSDQFMAGANKRVANENEWASNARNDIYKGYKSFADGGAGGLGGSGGGGGYTPQTYSPEKASIERAGMNNSALSGYTGEAGVGYRKLAADGGWSDGDKAGFRDRSVRTSNAFYNSLEGDIQRSNQLAGGGNGMAFTGSLQKLARQKAQAGQASLTDAELGMQENIRNNQITGYGGLRSVGNDETSNNQWNAGQANQVSMFNAGNENNMRQFNTSNENEARKYNINEANSAAASGAAAGGANARFDAQMRMQGLGGMQDMYNSSPGELGRQDDLLYNERHAGARDNQNNIDSRAQYNPKGPSAWDRAMQVAGMGVGAAGAFMNPASKVGGGLGGRVQKTVSV